MKKNNIVFLVIFLVLLTVIFKNWFLSPNIIGGDWPFFYQEYINLFSFLPPVWDSVHGNGLGGQSIIYTTDSYLYFTGWLFSVVFHIPWNIVYKVVWYGLFLVLSSCGSIYLINKIFPRFFLWQRLLAALIYTTNSYILLIVGGGQMGVALGYAVTPFVLARFIVLRECLFTDNKNTILRNSLLAGLLFSVQIIFDFRLAFITMNGVLLYVLVRFPPTLRQLFSLLLYIVFIPVGLCILLHAYWLLPLILSRQNPAASLGDAYTSVASLQYFSFATLEKTIALLHPYWPENIFGKVGFMKPEYLVLPILAFGSLLFVDNKKVGISSIKYQVIRENKLILFFGLIGLLGAFFAKGYNDPFGGIFSWMFLHIPGYIMFRDPTKFYLLIALSYSVLIPFSLWAFSNRLSSIKYQVIRKNAEVIIVSIFLFFWVVTIRQAVLGQLTGTFAYHEVPNEYVQLKNMLLSDQRYSRTLWLPKLQRFGFYNQTHPAVEGTIALGATTSAEMVKILQQKNGEQKLADSSIKYVIVPTDPGSEIFLKDRKYNPTERNIIIKKLNQIPWLTKDNDFKNIAIYTLKGSKDKFWMDGARKVSYQFISDESYNLIVSPGSSEKLIFNETYNPIWIATNDRKEFTHKQYSLFNSYVISDNSISTKINLSNASYPYIVLGRIISLVTFVSLCIFFFYFWKQKSS